MEELLAELEPQRGEGRIFRPYRDVRFSRDKSPYKTNIGAVIGDGYMQLDKNGLAAGCGMWEMATDQLERYRSAVDDDRSGGQLAGLVSGAEAAGLQVMSHDALKTAPRGYPKDHPRIELLRYKGIATWREWPAGPWLGSKRAKDRVSEFFERSEPIGEWLNANVGPSTLSAQRHAPSASIAPSSPPTIARAASWVGPVGVVPREWGPNAPPAPPTRHHDGIESEVRGAGRAGPRHDGGEAAVSQQVTPSVRPVIMPEAQYGQEIGVVQSPTVHSGWAIFAGVLFMVAGLWNFFAGWAALVRKEYFDEASLLYHNLQVVGWVWLGIGVIQVLASYLIFARRPSGRTLGVVLAALSMFVWFFTVGAYPMWAMMIVAIDALIIYGLTAHSEVFE